LKIATVEGDLVLDPFGGSGTTYAAAEEMHLHWIGIEIGIEIGDCEPIIHRLRGEEAAFDLPNRGDSGKGVSQAKTSREFQRAESLAKCLTN
jgi:site-specific DNA-methyltransferase (adenine-specific)